VDTNNLVESWHKTLKSGHLGSQRKIRVDHLIWMLQGAVDINLRVQNYLNEKGILPMTLSGYDKARRDKAMALDREVVDKMISTERIMDESKVCTLLRVVKSLSYLYDPNFVNL
jgi:hypothetical protein